MAHNIMEDRMFYSQDKPAWHNLGTVSTVHSTAEEILARDFKGGFTVDNRPVTVTLNGVPTETGDYAIVRSMTADPSSFEKVFGYCTNRYHPLQPLEICQTFDKNVNLFVETMAFLGDGNDMFISWNMPEFEVVKDDLIKLYGIVRTGFDTMKGTRLFTSTYRPVCQNTVNLAEGWAKQNTDGKGKGEIWSGKHTSENLLRDLGYWMEHVTQNAEREAGLIQSFFKKLADTPVKNDAEVHEILLNAYPPTAQLGEYYPAPLRADKESSIAEKSEKSAQIRDGIYNEFIGHAVGITPTLWGVLNATSSFYCHVLPSKKDISSSIMFGNRQKEIGAVVNVLKERVS